MIERFVEIGVAQDDALLDNKIARFNRLFDEKAAILAELKSRPGDQRRVMRRRHCGTPIVSWDDLSRR